MLCPWLEREDGRNSCASMELSCIALLQPKPSHCKAGFLSSGLAWDRGGGKGVIWSSVPEQAFWYDKDLGQRALSPYMLCVCEYVYVCMYKIMVIDFKNWTVFKDFLVGFVVQTDPSSLVNFFLLCITNSQDFIMNLTVVIGWGHSCAPASGVISLL